MPTVAEARKRLDWCGGDDAIVCISIWSVEDVIQRAKERDMTITKEQAEGVLNNMDNKQDCSMGVSWDTMDCYLDEIVSETE